MPGFDILTCSETGRWVRQKSTAGIPKAGSAETELIGDGLRGFLIFGMRNAPPSHFEILSLWDPAVCHSDSENPKRREPEFLRRESSRLAPIGKWNPNARKELDVRIPGTRIGMKLIPSFQSRGSRHVNCKLAEALLWGNTFLGGRQANVTQNRI